MSAAPLLVPSAVIVALATSLGVGLGVRGRRLSPLASSAAAAVFPALIAWLVLHAPLGEILRAPLVIVAGVWQVGCILALGRMPNPLTPVRAVAVAGLACALSVVTVGAGLLLGSPGRDAAAQADCVEASIQGGWPAFEGTDVKIAGGYVGPQTGIQWGPFTCTADITGRGGAARKQMLLGTPRQMSGSIFCPEVGILSCPRARILVIEATAYRTDDMSLTGATFAANRSAFGVPFAYLGLAILGACAALALCAAAARRLPTRARARGAGGHDVHPYRAPTLSAETPAVDLGLSKLVFAATLTALATAAPLATALALG